MQLVGALWFVSEPTIDLDFGDEKSLSQPLLPGNADLWWQGRVPIKVRSLPDFLHYHFAAGNEWTDESVRIVNGCCGSGDVSLCPLSALDFGRLGTVGPFVDRFELSCEPKEVFLRTGVVAHAEDLS